MDAVNGKAAVTAVRSGGRLSLYVGTTRIATIVLRDLVNGPDNIYFNNFKGPDGLTPPINTE